MKKLVKNMVVGSLIASLSSCGPKNDSELTSDSWSSGWLGSILRNNEDSPGWPAYPRRVGTLTEEFKNETTVTVGVEGSFFDVFKASAKSGLVLGINRSSNLLLVKTSERGAADLTYKKDGQVYLAYEPGTDFVGMCAYSMSMNVGRRFVGSVTIAGNGIENQSDFNKSVATTQTTNFFNIRDGDTVADLNARCDRVFQKFIKHRVANDYRNLTESFLETSPSVKYDKQVALEAALFGPEKKRLKIYNHHWNVKAASWERYVDGNRRKFKVSGWISNNIRAMVDNQFYYELVFANGRLESEWYSAMGGGWEEAARRLAKEIAEEAYLEFQPTMDELQVRDLPPVELYEHANFAGISATVGVGQYNWRTLDHDFQLNDRLSSLKVPVGLEVTLYEHADFVGASRTLRGGEHNLYDFNDQVSSIKVAYDDTIEQRHQLITDRGDQLVVQNDQPYLRSPGMSEGTRAEGDNGINSQFWRLEDAGEGYYYIKQDDRDLVLHAPAGGQLLELRTADGKAEQLWHFSEDLERPFCYLPVNKKSGTPMTKGQLIRGATVSSQQLYFCFSDRQYPLPKDSVEQLQIDAGKAVND
jgi:hypothetical protein